MSCKVTYRTSIASSHNKINNKKIDLAYQRSSNVLLFLLLFIFFPVVKFDLAPPFLHNINQPFFIFCQLSSRVTREGIWPWLTKSILFNLKQHNTSSGSSSCFCAWIVRPTSRIPCFTRSRSESSPFLDI